MVHSLIRLGIRFSLTLIGALGLISLFPSIFSQTSVWGLKVWQLNPNRVEIAPKLPVQSPGDCGPLTIPRLLFEDDVETGVLGWTHTGQYDLWSMTSWRSFSESHAWHADALAVISDESLISAPILLPENETPLSLRYWNYQDFENSLAGCYDGALLEISTNGGLSWTQLDSQLLNDPYDGVIEAQGGNPLAGRPAWCGHPQDWFESIVALDEYGGQIVKFRFRIGTDNSHSREGWYLDDIVIQSCPSAYSASIQNESRLSGLPGQQIVHQFRLENQGLEDHYSFQLEAGNWPSELMSSAEVNLFSGQVFTASVMVDLPATPGGQRFEDVFRVKVDSTGNPGLVLESTGISSLAITPAVSIAPNQNLLFGVPGEIVTHTFTLTNTGDCEDLFRLDLSGVEWPAWVSSDTGRMQSGEEKTILVPVTIPVGPLMVDVIVITDTFTLRAESGWNVQIGDEAISSTSTGLFAGLKLDGPAIIDAFAGQPLLVYFYITNLGNFTDRYILDWQGDWLPSAPVTGTGWIAPGAREELLVSIPIPGEIQDGESRALTLKAISHLDSAKQGQIYLTIHGWKRIFLPLINQSQ